MTVFKHPKKVSKPLDCQINCHHCHLSTGCTLIERGVAAIFGPQSVESSTHIQSICATLNIPHVEFRPELSPFPANQSVNLFPHANLFGAAIKDLIRNKKWRKFAIIYQENEGNCYLFNLNHCKYCLESILIIGNVFLILIALF